jgi:hypothetical protein
MTLAVVSPIMVDVDPLRSLDLREQTNEVTRVVPVEFRIKGVPAPCYGSIALASDRADPQSLRGIMRVP